jgi:hypothetical protein
MVALVEQELDSADVVRVPTLARLEFELLLSSVKDNHVQAADIANQLLEELENHAPVDRLTLGMNCGLALFLAGRTNAAIDAYERTYSIAASTQSIDHQLHTSLLLCAVYCNSGDGANWDAWLSRAEQLVNRNLLLSDKLEFAVTRVLRAFFQNDLAQARFLVEEADQLGVFSDGMARQRWGRALKVLLRAREGQVNSDDLVFARAALHEPVRSVNGFRDVEIVAAATALKTFDSRESRELVERYLAEERLPCPPLAGELVRMIAELRIDPNGTMRL